MKHLTEKQQLIYNFIQSAMEDRQVPPSLREIGRHLDLSVGTVQDQVEAIRRKGFLEKENTVARGLKLPFQQQEIPILGRVHAGPLHAAIEDVEGHLPVGKSLSVSQHFALRVRGDSMIEAGIFEEDMVIVRAQQTANPGEIVVARVDDEATVKTFRRNGQAVWLEPANPNYAPIKNTPFVIIGVVVELRRKYQGR